MPSASPGPTVPACSPSHTSPRAADRPYPANSTPHRPASNTTRWCADSASASWTNLPGSSTHPSPAMNPNPTNSPNTNGQTPGNRDRG